MKTLAVNFINSFAWVSLEARETWAEKFKELNLSLIKSTLEGLKEGRWHRRSMILYGNNWTKFLSLIPKYNIPYQKEIIKAPKNAAQTAVRVVISENLNSKQNLSECCMNTTQDQDLFSFQELKQASSEISVIFWQMLGLSFFAESPCSLNCQTQIALVQEHLSYMKTIGCEDEAKTIEAILKWPLKWTALHLIEEVSSPICKFAYLSQKIYPEKHSLYLESDTYPEESASGLYFPYKQKKAQV